MVVWKITGAPPRRRADGPNCPHTPHDGGWECVCGWLCRARTHTRWMLGGEKCAAAAASSKTQLVAATTRHTLNLIIQKRAIYMSACAHTIRLELDRDTHTHKHKQLCAQHKHNTTEWQIQGYWCECDRNCVCVARPPPTDILRRGGVVEIRRRRYVLRLFWWPPNSFTHVLQAPISAAVAAKTRRCHQCQKPTM